MIIGEAFAGELFVDGLELLGLLSLGERLVDRNRGGPARVEQEATETVLVLGRNLEPRTGRRRLGFAVVGRGRLGFTVRLLRLLLLLLLLLRSHFSESLVGETVKSLHRWSAELGFREKKLLTTCESCEEKPETFRVYFNFWEVCIAS